MKQYIQGMIAIFIVTSMCWEPVIFSQEQPSAKKSFIQRQLDRLAQSRAVREIAIFKDLPGAIDRCYILRSNCSQIDKKTINKAMVRIPIIMAAFAAITGIIFSKTKPHRVKYEDLTEKNKENLKNNMVLAINTRDAAYLQEYLGKVTFPQYLLNSFLQLAVSTADNVLVTQLLDAGAQASALDAKGNSHLYWAARRSTFGPSESSEYKIAQEIITSLLAHNAPVNTPGEDGKTPIMWAAGAGREELVRIFLKAGADTSIRDNEGMSVADYAQTEDLKQLLLKR